jgi:hypothetical protein
MELSMELCNVVVSIKKKLIKLGFCLLKDIQPKKECNINNGNEEEFKVAVSHLIKKK